MTTSPSSDDACYFGATRPEVAALVPQGTRSALDLGCGFGGLGRTLRERGVERLYGVERNPDAAPHLERIYDRFWIGNVEDVVIDTEVGNLDCLVFADILEHLVDPWSALTRHATLLAPGGCVVASIPNVRNLALLYNLAARGRWRYASSGLLDRGHLRFFTRTEIHELFEGAGLSIETIDVNRDAYSPLRRIASAIPRALVPDLDVCQFLVRARRREAPRP